MESIHLNTENKDLCKTNPTATTEYNPKMDWKFQSVVFMANNFTSTLGIEPFTAVDLELSFRNPKLDPLCLNILYKLLLKKAMFKPTLKITDWESKLKLQQMLAKKLVYFYKVYARTISSRHHLPFSKEAIEIDLKSVQGYDRFNIRLAESYYGEIEVEPDLKKLMVLELFRSLNGKNPLFKEEMYSSQKANISIPIVNGDLKKEADNNESNKDEFNIEINIKNNDEAYTNKKLNDSDEESVKSDELSIEDKAPSKNKHKKKNEDNDSDFEEDNYEPAIPQSKNAEVAMNYSLIDPNIKEDQYSSLIDFEDFDIKEKVEILYFFFLYAIEYSGRSYQFKQEATENNHLNKLLDDSKVPKISYTVDCSSIFINKSSLPHLNNNQQYELNKASLKKNKILGYDNYNNCYSIPLCNKSCVIVKDYFNKESTVETICHNYSEVEGLLEKLEKNKLESNLDIELNESHKEKTRKDMKKNKSTLNIQINRQNELTNNIKDLLLSFKEFDEEEKKKESNFQKKTVIASKNAAQGKEFVLMNMTDHITTRRQLNKLAQEAVPIISGMDDSMLHNKYREPSYDELKRLKAEQQNLERERRMKERGKQFEDKYTRPRKERGRINYNENSEFEGESDNTGNAYSNNVVAAENRKIRIKTTDSNSNSEGKNEDKKDSEDKYSEYQVSRSSENEDFSETSEYKNYRISGRKKSKKGRIYKEKKSSVNTKNVYNSGLITNNRDMNLTYEVNQIDEIPENEIIMDCSLVLRYPLNQLEIVGNWGVSSDSLNEKMSYLFSKSNEKQRMFIKKNDLMYEKMENNELKNAKTNVCQPKSEVDCEGGHLNDNNENNLSSFIFPDVQPSNSIDTGIKKKDVIFFTSKDLENYEPIDICISNLHELIQINHNGIFNEILKFLSTEYAGYFVYFSKTIEDKFTLTLKAQDTSLIYIEGEGVNCLGKFKIKGYMNLFRDKVDLLRNNNVEDDFIRIAKIKMSRHYLVFNPNENERVMKSFTHRKRRKDETGEVIYGLSYTAGRRGAEYNYNPSENKEERNNVYEDEEFGNYDDDLMN